MLPDLKLAIRLQNLDDRAAVLTKEVAVLPKHIAEIEKKLEFHQRRLDLNKTAMAANVRDRRKAEGESVVASQKITKLKGQMLEAKNNDQYRAFQNEIDFCENEISRCDEVILNLMAKLEPLEKGVKEAEAALAVERAEVEAEKAKAHELTAADRAKLAELNKVRAETAAQVTRGVLSEYERIRKGRVGVAVAEVVNGRCSKCNMSVRLQFLQELRVADKIMNCESCRRILYLNPPESFEDLVSIP